MARKRVSKQEILDYEKDKKHWMVHKRMMAGKMIALGALVIANAYWGILNWSWFIGGILVLAGLSKLIMPSCRHCKM